MGKKLILLFFLALSVVGGEVFADEAAARQLQALLQGADALEGNFQQRLSDQDGTLLQETEGRFVVQRPGNFYWETLPPYEQVVVSDSTTLWVYDPDLEQVTVQQQQARDQVSPAQLLSGELADLREHYQVELEEQGETRRFTLTPLQEDALFARLQMEYDGTALKALSFEDNLGQTTALSFSDIRINPDLSPTVFQFDIPPGVDVIVDG